jgi:hypothetical protein
MRKRSSVFVLLLLSATRLHAEQTLFEKPWEETSLYFNVVIDEQGRLATAKPHSPAPMEVQRAGIAAVKALGFEPATLEGKPAAMETGLHLVLRFDRQRDGSFRAVLKSARLGPLVTSGYGTETSARGRRSATGVLIAAVAVREDGSVDPGRMRIVDSATSKDGRDHLEDFERRALESIAKWQFRPDRVGGRLVASSAEAIVRFCTTDCTVPAEPAPSADRAALPVSLTPGVQLARVKAANPL